jgi:hypothetical protein
VGEPRYGSVATQRSDRLRQGFRQILHRGGSIRTAPKPGCDPCAPPRAKVQSRLCRGEQATCLTAVGCNWVSCSSNAKGLRRRLAPTSRKRGLPITPGKVRGFPLRCALPLDLFSIRPDQIDPVLSRWSVHRYAKTYRLRCTIQEASSLSRGASKRATLASRRRPSYHANPIR